MYSTVEVKWHAYYFRETPNMTYEHMTYKQNIDFTLQSVVFLTSGEKSFAHCHKDYSSSFPTQYLEPRCVHISC